MLIKGRDLEKFKLFNEDYDIRINLLHVLTYEGCIRVVRSFNENKEMIKVIDKLFITNKTKFESNDYIENTVDKIYRLIYLLHKCKCDDYKKRMYIKLIRIYIKCRVIFNSSEIFLASLSKKT